MTKGEKNFIESKDTLYYNFPTNCLLHGTLILFCATDILMYLFKIEYRFFQGTFFGFIFAIVIAATDILNVLARLCLQKKFQHAYYGICIVLISLYFSYLAIKAGLYPFDQLFGFLAVCVWIISSLIFIYAINDNIRNDRYNQGSESLYFFKDQGKNKDGKKYGIVITKHIFIIAFIYVITAIALITVYFTAKNLFGESDKLLVNYAHVGLIGCLFFLSCFTNFGWKLIVKQICLNKVL